LKEINPILNKEHLGLCLLEGIIIPHFAAGAGNNLIFFCKGAFPRANLYLSAAV
jgi:hypothetical protein